MLFLNCMYYRCIKTYEIQFSAVASGKFRRINPQDTIFLSFQYSLLSGMYYHYQCHNVHFPSQYGNTLCIASNGAKWKCVSHNIGIGHINPITPAKCSWHSVVSYAWYSSGRDGVNSTVQVISHISVLGKLLLKTDLLGVCWDCDRSCK
jgi:hypothetical protein